MIQHLIHAMQPAKLPVEIGVAHSNPQALALYKKLGFVRAYELDLNLGEGKEQVIYLRLPQ